jgi:hypothetical protein
MYSIKQGELKDIAIIEAQIPEFSSPKKLVDIKERLAQSHFLLLIS